MASIRLSGKAEILDMQAIGVDGAAIDHPDATQTATYPFNGRFQAVHVTNHRFAQCQRKTDFDAGSRVGFAASKRVEIGKNGIGKSNLGDIGAKDTSRRGLYPIERYQRFMSGMSAQGTHLISPQCRVRPENVGAGNIKFHVLFHWFADSS